MVAKEKGWGAQEQILRNKVAFLKKKLKEHEDLYATKVAQLKEVLKASVREVENIEGEAAKQYVEGFDEAIKQVKFLYSDLDVSSYVYFKEICDGQLVDKPLPHAIAAEVEAGDQTRTPKDVPPLANQGEG